MNFTLIEKILFALIVLTILTTVCMPFVPDLFLHMT